MAVYNFQKAKKGAPPAKKSAPPAKKGVKVDPRTGKPDDRKGRDPRGGPADDVYPVNPCTTKCLKSGMSRSQCQKQCQ